MARCDLCNCNCSHSSMTQLMKIYQTEGIVDLCPSCAKFANTTKDELMRSIPKLVQEALKGKLNAPFKVSLWKRILYRF